MGKMFTRILVVVVVLVAGAFGRIGGGKLFELLSQPSDSQIREKLESQALKSRTLQAIKTNFPAEYEQYVEMVLLGVKQGSSGDVIMNQAAKLTADIRTKNAVQLTKASINTLREILTSQADTYSYVKTKFGFQACNEMAVNGGPGLIQKYGALVVKDATFTSKMDNSSGILIEALAEGKRLGLSHGVASDEDWSLLGQRMVSEGTPNNDLNILADMTKFKNDPRLCEIAINLMVDATKLDPTVSERIIPALAAGQAGP